MAKRPSPASSPPSSPINLKRGTTLPKRDLLTLLRTMLRVRCFEQKVKELFLAGKVRGTAHSSVGQEGIAAGATWDLGPDDFMVTHHRAHGHPIARGVELRRMFAEVMGRAAGCCGGLGGSMHIADLARGIVGANGILGAGIGIGAGVALAGKLRELRQAGVVFFGDGTSSEGLFHEALNLAALWRLPVVFFCENNQYGLSTPTRMAIAGGGVARRADAYGIPGAQIDGNDVVEVREAVRTALTRARAGEGPTLIEAVTYRWEGHSMRANLPKHRPDDEVRAWQETSDPIRRLSDALLERGWLTETELSRLRSEVEAEAAQAIQWAEAQPEPEEIVLTAAAAAPRAPMPEPSFPATPARELTYVEALTEAMRQEMERDGDVFVIGEDIGRIGGIFGVTRGLLEAFGPKRILETPIAEQAIAGAGVGAALAGMRPIVEIQIADFAALMMDMIANQACKLRFMMGANARLAIVFRGPQGGGLQLAAQHSQSIESWFMGLPGLTIVAPADPYDAKGLLIAAIRDDNPVLFLEHKRLYISSRGPVPEQPYAIPLGRAAVKREGGDVTVVATSSMVERALQAARVLEAEGVNVEVIDPRTLRPLDDETIVASVRKTGRAVVAHEAPTFGGMGAEIAATIMEKAFDYLDAPVARVGAAGVPVPYNGSLERLVLPGLEDVVAAVRQTVA